MKKTLITLMVLTLLSFKVYETKYVVSYDLKNWQEKMNLIEYTKNVLKNSSIPANIVLPLSDSLTKFQNDIVAQIQPQMKVDSTKKK